MRALVLAAVTAGCFRPSAPLGDPCAPDNWCPPPQICDLGTHTCGTTAIDAGIDAAMAAPNVTISPGAAPLLDTATFQWCNAYPVAEPVVIDADDPNATIFYSTDTSPPTAHGHPPVAFTPTGNNTTITYYATNAVGTAPTATETYAVANSCTATWGFVVTDTKLGGKGPIVDAKPNEQLSSSATVQMWANGCTGCGVSIVYGIGTSYQGCLYVDNATSNYPGDTHAISFMLTAPASGTHDVLARFVFNSPCSAAESQLQSSPSAWEPRKIRIGVVVVH